VNGLLLLCTIPEGLYI